MHKLLHKKNKHYLEFRLLGTQLMYYVYVHNLQPCSVNLCEVINRKAPVSEVTH